MEKEVRRTKGGNLVWSSSEIKITKIIQAMEDEGYDVAISREQVKNNKYFIARSATTVHNRIESAYRTEKQREKVVRDWNRYDHLHDSIHTINRDYFEYVASEKILKVH